MKARTKWTALTVLLIANIAGAEQPDTASIPQRKASPPPIRLAIFDLQVDKRVDVTAEALTDRVLAICGAMKDVTLVDRAQLAQVAHEHKISLSGLTDAGAGVKLGRFVAATHILVGRLSAIGQSNYLILKLINVETTEQQVVSLRAPMGDSLDQLFDPLEQELARALSASATSPDALEESEDLRQAAAWLRGATVVIDIGEKHINRPLPDPAAAVVAFNLLQKLGVNVILPSSPPDGWKEALRASGMYQENKADYLLEGEGISSFAAEIQGMTSCRARVELRLVPVPGRNVLVTETGIGAEVDLAEALAAKAALEEATREALRLLIRAGEKRIGG